METSTTMPALSLPSSGSVVRQGLPSGAQRLARPRGSLLVPQNAVAPSGRCATCSRAVPCLRPFSSSICAARRRSAPRPLLRSACGRCRHAARAHMQQQQVVQRDELQHDRLVDLRGASLAHAVHRGLAPELCVWHRHVHLDRRQPLALAPVRRLLGAARAALEGWGSRVKGRGLVARAGAPGLSSNRGSWQRQPCCIAS